MKNLPRISRSSWLIAGIVMFVFVLLALMLVAQQSFSHRIKQVTLTKSSSSVSPEFYESTQVTISSGSCKVVVSKYNAPEQTEKCSIDDEDFSKIKSAIYSYRVVDKMIANSSESGLIEDKKLSMTIELQDGTTFTAILDSQFVEDMAPFFEEIQLLVPELGKVMPNQ